MSESPMNRPYGGRNDAPEGGEPLPGEQPLSGEDRETDAPDRDEPETGSSSRAAREGTMGGQGDAVAGSATAPSSPGPRDPSSES